MISIDLQPSFHLQRHRDRSSIEGILRLQSQWHHWLMTRGVQERSLWSKPVKLILDPWSLLQSSVSHLTLMHDPPWTSTDELYNLGWYQDGLLEQPLSLFRSRSQDQPMKFFWTDNPNSYYRRQAGADFGLVAWVWMRVYFWCGQTWQTKSQEWNHIQPWLTLNRPMPFSMVSIDHEIRRDLCRVVFGSKLWRPQSGWCVEDPIQKEACIQLANQLGSLAKSGDAKLIARQWNLSFRSLTG